MESAPGAGWNHGNAVYGIKPQELYSIRASRNVMRDFVGIGEEDLISSEAIRRRFHPSIELQNNSLGFHRAEHDFIKDTRLTP